MLGRPKVPKMQKVYTDSTARRESCTKGVPGERGPCSLSSGRSKLKKVAWDSELPGTQTRDSKRNMQVSKEGSPQIRNGGPTSDTASLSSSR